MKSVNNKIAIVVPVYSRPDDLIDLLKSVNAMSCLPGEIVLREDKSPARAQLALIAEEWKLELAKSGCNLIYIENEENLGFDGNVRSLFNAATADWALILGNDDVVLPDACLHIENFLLLHPDVKFISRSFVRFVNVDDNPIGVSRFSSADAVFDPSNSSAGQIFRLAGFVGGLVINRRWAVSQESSDYDGTLYYQIYLAGRAFYSGGIGYISNPIAGGRTGNPPLFGAAKTEKNSHVPGSYTPKGRASMWRGVILIAEKLQERFGGNILSEMKRELAGYQSFHIFEMTCLQGRAASFQLFVELRKLDLVGSLMPWCFLVNNLLFGRYALFFYKAMRKFVQR